MKEKYKSKVSIANYILIGLFTLITIGMIIGCIMKPETTMIILTVIFAALDGLVMLPMLFDTYYVLEEKEIFIKNWIFCKLRIRYTKIQDIRAIKNRSSSAAMSSDRIRIKFMNEKGKYETVFISPVNKQEFMKKLTAKIK